MFVRGSIALAVILSVALPACRVIPDRDYLDRSGHYHQEVVDEGSYAVYQYQGACWERVGYVWVGPEAEHSVWVLRRPGSGGYPYRPPSSGTPEMWTRFKRIPREDASVDDLVAAEHLEVARFYAIDSHQVVRDLQNVTAEPPTTPAAGGGAPGAATEAAYRLMRDGRTIGYQWTHDEEEVFLFERGAARAIHASATTAGREPSRIFRVRLEDAGPLWTELLDSEAFAGGEYEVFACRAGRTQPIRRVESAAAVRRASDLARMTVSATPR